MSQITEPKFILLDGVDKSGKSYAVSFLQDKYPDKLAFLLGGPKNKEIHPKNETPKKRFFRFLDYNLERSEEIKQALAQGKHALTDWYFPRTVSSNSVIHREHCGREDLDSYVEHSRFARPDLVIPLLVDYDTLVKRLKQSPAEHAYEQDPILLLRFQAELMKFLNIYERNGIVGAVLPVNNSISFQESATKNLEEHLQFFRIL